MFDKLMLSADMICFDVGGCQGERLGEIPIDEYK